MRLAIDPEGVFTNDLPFFIWQSLPSDKSTQDLPYAQVHLGSISQKFEQGIKNISCIGREKALM